MAPPGDRPSPSELKSCLDREFSRLGIDPAKVAAAAPAGEANAVFDLQAEIYTGDPPIVSFSWTERALGDYNQDGLVSVNDLTPIGQHYNESVEHEDPSARNGLTHWPSGDPDDAGATNWRAARIDGNDDGLIYLTDITTIAQHWNERLDGYRVYVQTPSMDDFALLPNPGDGASPLTVPRSVADPSDASRPFRYELNYTPPAEEGVFHFYVTAYDASADSEGTASPVLTLPEGEPPVAALTAAPLYGNPPLDVDFDASGSYAVEGEITGYDWDFYGSGFFSEHTTEPHTTNTYSESGTYTAAVRVTDSHFLRDSATIEITTNTPPVAVIEADPAGAVAPFDATITVDGSYDPDGEIVLYEWDIGNDGSFESNNTEPTLVIRTHNWPGEFVTALRVTDDHGLTDTATVTVTAQYGEWRIQTLDSAFADAGEGCSLGLIDGVPAVAYYHMGQQCLMFTRASEEFGTEPWHTPQALTPPGPPDEGAYQSLSTIEGHPAIAYFDIGASEVRYIRANNASGSDWPAEAVTIHPNLGTNITLQAVDGRPAVTYLTLGNDVFYQRATNPTGGIWTDLPREIDEGSDDHWGPRLEIIDGFPAVAYMRSTGGRNVLMYVRAADAAGADPWNSPVNAYSHLSETVGFRGSLAELSGHPAVFFPLCEAGGYYGKPQLIRSQSSTGAEFSWSMPPAELAEEDGPSADYYNSLAVINGLPHVVFHDPVSSALYHAWGTDPAGTAWLEPVVVDDGGDDDTGGYCSLADINGRPAVAYQNITAGRLMYAVLR